MALDMPEENMRFTKIVLSFLFPIATFAQKNTSSFEAYMQGQSGLYKFNGNVLVAKNGKTIYKKTFGYADFNLKEKLDNNSIFDIGSIAKEFTAVGILSLIDKGKLNYSDSLGKFFPQLPYSNVTIRQLLTHTSGMPDGYDLVDKYFDHNKIAENQDLLKLLALYKPELYFIPGTDLQYSGTGFNLLACIIEKISGESYSHFIDTHIFKLLGMSHTRVANFPRNKNNEPRLAVGFMYNDSAKKYIPANSIYHNWATYFSGITGEGMIISTTGDLLKWDRALKDHKILSAARQAEMVTVQAEKKTFPKVQFGYGIRSGKNENGNYVFHNGWFPGFASMLIRYVHEDVTVIVLSNNLSHSEFVADGLATIALNKKIILPYKHEEKNINFTPGKYEGKYLLPIMHPPYMVDFPVEIILKNSKLYIHSPAIADIELIPESETKFFYGDGSDQQLIFTKDSGGNIAKVFYIGYGVKKEIVKIN
ncbi:MAG: serine hydrolase domain-containing protein [Ginsengibacter sp.]